MKNHPQITQAILITLMTIIGSFIGTYFTIYFGSYLQEDGVRRTELANDLSDYYSSGSAEYYADKQLNEAAKDGWNKDSPYYLELFKSEDIHYKEFVSASTKLATEVPPDLRDKVLSIEDEFTKVNGVENSSTDEEWFDKLNSIRQVILDNTVFKKSLNPIWK